MAKVSENWLVINDICTTLSFCSDENEKQMEKETEIQVGYEKISSQATGSCRSRALCVEKLRQQK